MDNNLTANKGMQIREVLAAIASRADAELLALQETELYDLWYWSWDDDRSVEWNTYKFSNMLEMHKRRCRRWEEEKNGHSCVVERVRDKYLMPRVREFLTALEKHNISGATNGQQN